MKILFCAINGINPPHFEQLLDILLHHREKGDEVYIVQCRGHLKYCYANLYNNLSLCQYCRDRFDYAMQLINMDKNHILPLPQKEVPANVYEKTFQNIDQLKNYSYGDFKELGSCVASIIIDITNDHKPDVSKYAKAVKNYLKSTYAVFLGMQEIVEKAKPDYAILFNGRSLDCRANLQVMRNNHVPFDTFERGGYHDRYMLFHNTMCQNLATIRDSLKGIVQNATAEDWAQAKAFFDLRRTRKATNWRSFTSSQKSGLLPNNLDKSKKIITIFNSSVSEYICVPDLLPGLFPEDIISIREIALYFKDKPQYQVYLRVHPHLKDKLKNTQMQEIMALKKENIPNFSVIMPQESIDTYALLDASDKVVSFGSTMGLEATYWGKPSILIGDAYWRTLDVAYEPQTLQELFELLTTDELAAKPFKNALQCGLREITSGIKTKYYIPESPWTGKFMGRYLIPPGKYFNRRLDYFIRKWKFKIKGW